MGDTQEHKRRKVDTSTTDEFFFVKIVSALYAPCEGPHYQQEQQEQQQQHASTGGNLETGDETGIPLTRDVTPFLRALLRVQQHKETETTHSQGATHSRRSYNYHGDTNAETNCDAYCEPLASVPTTEDSSWVRLPVVLDGQRRVQIGILLLDEMDGTGVATGISGIDRNRNAPIDQVVATTLTAAQTITRQRHVNASGIYTTGNRCTGTGSSMGMNGIFGDPAPGLSKRLHIHYVIAPEQQPKGGNSTTQYLHSMQGEAHSASFAEHERVYLQLRSWTHVRAAFSIIGGTTGNDATWPAVHKFDTNPSAPLPAGISVSKSNSNTPASQNDESDLPVASVSRAWDLDDFEEALPLIAPFLQLRERVQCRLVCSLWRDIVQELGVAVVVDDDDRTLYPHWNRTVLRGILSHSFASLQRLRLSHTLDLEPRDLHPALPHLRKLQALDISRCVKLGDSTLCLLAQCVSNTLEVLYLKGLDKVSDHGLAAIAQSCRRLKVLDISFLSAITDVSLRQIGHHLTHLRAIYLRDNYLVTNASVDVLTEECTSLEQLALWGTIRLNHLNFGRTKKSNSLVLLNLWGCHSLRDDAAMALVGMTQLRTLIVSECHQLTDNFVAAVTRYVPQLSHLQLRYCKYLSDSGVHAIAQSMPNLYSLDLSFCTKVTVAALVSLIEIRGRSLAELRLRGCRNLDIAHDPQHAGHRLAQMDLQRSRVPIGGYAGRQLLAALRSQTYGQRCLSVLDVRHCGGCTQSSPRGYRETDPFAMGMTALLFEQKTSGYFVRPARWNPDIDNQLMKAFLSVKP